MALTCCVVPYSRGGGVTMADKEVSGEASAVALAVVNDVVHRVHSAAGVWARRFSYPALMARKLGRARGETCDPVYIVTTSSSLPFKYRWKWVKHCARRGDRVLLELGTHAHVFVAALGYAQANASPSSSQHASSPCRTGPEALCCCLRSSGSRPSTEYTKLGDA